MCNPCAPLAMHEATHYVHLCLARPSAIRPPEAGVCRIILYYLLCPILRGHLRANATVKCDEAFIAPRDRGIAGHVVPINALIKHLFLCRSIKTSMWTGFRIPQPLQKKKEKENDHVQSDIEENGAIPMTTPRLLCATSACSARWSVPGLFIARTGCSQSRIQLVSHHPRFETPRGGSYRSFELLPTLPPPRPSSRLRRPISLTCMSKTSGSSSASLSPRPAPYRPLELPAKLPREDCGGVGRPRVLV